MSRGKDLILSDLFPFDVRVDIRADKTLFDLDNANPSSRWDPTFWNPKFDEALSEISSKYKMQTIGSLLNEPIIAPDHVRASKGEKICSKYNVEYRTLKDLLFTGLNYAHINYCSDNAYKRLKRTQLKVNDILFAGSGVGAIGRIGLVEKVIMKKSCVGDLFIIRNTKVNQQYLYVYLLTEFGQIQIKKIFHGVQSAKISTKEIESLSVVIVPEIIQKHIESSYKIIFSVHNKAMECRKSKNEKVYEKNMSKASAMLNELIEKTEDVIRGKQKDVI